MSGRQSSRVTKVPLAELHRVFKFMESMEFAMKRKRIKNEIEQEVESEKEENNTQGRRHMCMDGMK